MIIPFFISHSGCPHQCVFCDQQTITGTPGGFPSAATIEATIDAYLLSSADGSHEVAFYGGTFTSLPGSVQQSLLEPVQPFISSGRISSVRISTRPDAIDRATVKNLLECGVRTVELGVQSMDDRVLNASGRGHSSGEVRRAAAIIAGAGMKLGIQLMPGLPGSSAEGDLVSFREALILAPDFFRIYPALVLAGTPLAGLFLSGDFRPLSLAEAVQLCAAMLHRALLASVPVIRMGLQASDSLAEAGRIVAGPYHPAFRQLVESELAYALLARLSDGIEANTRVAVRCAPSRISDVTGQRRSNISRLFAATGIIIEKITADNELSAQDMVLAAPGEERRGNLLRDL